MVYENARDLLQWTIDVEPNTTNATLTLKGMNWEECEGVIALITEMRAAKTGTVLTKPSPLGKPFLGLESE